jgi:pimeloyl-ACP methyl ester carboxylesterase
VAEPIEHIARVGADERIVGLVTLPDKPRPGAPGLVLMNAGVIHRIGPHRFNVKLARAAAQDGITSIRIDLSGLGDTPNATTASHFGQQSIRDLQAAMDHLEQHHGIRRFIVYGLCSGAVNGYRLALADERVAGLLMFDGYVYPTWKTHIVRRLVRFRALPWSALLRKPLQWLRRQKPAERAPELGESSDDTHLGIPTRPEFAQAMQTLVTRGTSVYLVYSGSFLESHNYAGQLRDAFGGAMFLDHVRYDFMADVDHTVTSLASQRKVLAAIRDWIQSVPVEASARTGTTLAPASGAGSTGRSIQESLSPP